MEAKLSMYFLPLSEIMVEEAPGLPGAQIVSVSSHVHGVPVLQDVVYLDVHSPSIESEGLCGK